MKTTKRILSAALALVLGLALLVPAFAADEPGLYAPIITKQPDMSIGMPYLQAGKDRDFPKSRLLLS